ncbi:MAG: hypothetical protein V9F04_13030 [Dermatophilaceae bacterium]
MNVPSAFTVQAIPGEVVPAGATDPSGIDDRLLHLERQASTTVVGLGRIRTGSHVGLG